VPLVFDTRAKFKVSSSNRVRDMEGSQNYKIRSRDPFATFFDLSLYFFYFPVVNLSGKFDANIFIIDRYYGYFTASLIWLRNAYSRPFGEVFWGFDPLNVVGYCGDPKSYILGWKHAFWHTVRYS